MHSSSASSSQSQRSGLALASLLTGIPGVLCFPAGIVSIVLGVLALRETIPGSSGTPGGGGAKQGREMAIGGIVLGSVGLLIACLGSVIAFQNSDQAPPSQVLVQSEQPSQVVEASGAEGDPVEDPPYVKRVVVKVNHPLVPGAPPLVRAKLEVVGGPKGLNRLQLRYDPVTRKVSLWPGARRRVRLEKGQVRRLVGLERVKPAIEQGLRQWRLEEATTKRDARRFDSRRPFRGRYYRPAGFGSEDGISPVEVDPPRHIHRVAVRVQTPFAPDRLPAIDVVVLVKGVDHVPEDECLWVRGWFDPELKVFSGWESKGWKGPLRQADLEQTHGWVHLPEMVDEALRRWAMQMAG